MPLFRRKTAERQVKPPTTVQNLAGSDLHRTTSNRSNRSLPHSPGTPDSWGEDSDMGLTCNVLNGNIPGEKRPRTLMLTESVLQDGQDIPADSLESPLRTSSRLSKTLLEVIRDKDALVCFKSFMSSQKAEHFIQFWCDAESFHASTLTRMRTHLLQALSKSVIHKRRSNSLCHPITDTCSRDERVSISDEADVKTVTPCESTLSNSQSISDSLKCPENRQVVESTGQTRDNSKNSSSQHIHTSPAFSTEVVISYSPELPPSLLKYSYTEQSTHQSVSDKVPNVSTNDHMKPSELSAIPTHMPSEATQPTTLKALCDCDTFRPVNSRELNLATNIHQHQTQAASPQQPSPIDPKECGTLKSPSESSQEDIAQKLKKSIERDAVTIFSTYIAKDAPQPIGVDDILRSEVISQICKENGEVDPECFIGCQRFVLNRLDTEYFQSFRDSEYHCRHQVNVLTTEKVYLPDVLFNENALCYFMEYMEQDGASDLMQMWLAADNFQQQLTLTIGRYDADQAQNDAMVIYDRYFSLQATNPIGFDDSLRFEIESNICREGGPLPDCFTKAKNIVLKILEKVYFPNYLHGHIYYRYLSDLLSTVQISEDVPGKLFQKGHKRAESDASSEHSAGSQSTGAESVVSRNTLLAVDTRKHRKGSTIEGDFSMSMDMFNPDDLWKRSEQNNIFSFTASNLNLGYVNELGQFVSKFEHGADTDKKKGPILFKRRKEKEKEEEEMALRIAKLIISDVNTMTKTGETMMTK